MFTSQFSDLDELFENLRNSSKLDTFIFHELTIIQALNEVLFFIEKFLKLLS